MSDNRVYGSHGVARCGTNKTAWLYSRVQLTSRPRFITLSARAEACIGPSIGAHAVRYTCWRAALGGIPFWLTFVLGLTLGEESCGDQHRVNVALNSANCRQPLSIGALPMSVSPAKQNSRCTQIHLKRRLTHHDERPDRQRLQDRLREDQQRRHRREIEQAQGPRCHCQKEFTRTQLQPMRDRAPQFKKYGTDERRGNHRSLAQV